MIVYLVSNLLLALFVPILFFINQLVTYVPNLPTLPVVHFFGAVGTLNDILPISEWIAMATVAVGLKLMIAYYKLTMVTLFFTKNVLKVVLSFRL